MPKRRADRDVDISGMSKDEAALTGIEKLAEFIKECEIPTTLRELGATEEMLPKIAASSVKGGGYKQMDTEDILAVLKACY